MTNPAAGTVVVIPCGGRGARLRPLTDRTPKSLLPVYGRPVIDYVLDSVLSKGFKRVILSTGYRSAQVVDYISQSYSDTSVECFRPAVAGTCGILVDPAFQPSGDRVLIVYSDVLALPDLAQLVADHQLSGRALSLTVHPGTFKVNGCSRLPDDLSSSRPVAHAPGPGNFWTYAPIAVMETALINTMRRELAERRPSSFDLVNDIVQFVAPEHANLMKLDAPIIDVGEGVFAAGLLAARALTGQ